MIQDGSSMNEALNSTKTASTPSHDHLLDPADVADESLLTESQRLDRSAMESAKRAQNRIHSNEERSPESTIFSK